MRTHPYKFDRFMEIISAANVLLAGCAGAVVSVYVDDLLVNDDEAELDEPSLADSAKMELEIEAGPRAGLDGMSASDLRALASVREQALDSQLILARRICIGALALHDQSGELLALLSDPEVIEIVAEMEEALVEHQRLAPSKPKSPDKKRKRLKKDPLTEAEEEAEAAVNFLDEDEEPAGYLLLAGDLFGPRPLRLLGDKTGTLTFEEKEDADEACDALKKMARIVPVYRIPR